MKEQRSSVSSTDTMEEHTAQEGALVNRSVPDQRHGLRIMQTLSVNSVLGELSYLQKNWLIIFDVPS